MVAFTPPTSLGTDAPRFELPDAAGMIHRLEDLRGEKGTVVAFICNHCPYVIAVAGRIARAAQDLRVEGVATVAIMPNDWNAYPQDAPARMGEFAARHGFDFPYLVDGSQAVARAFGAVCTPDFFGFDANLKLAYRGRLDESARQPGPVDARRELVEAMTAVATGRPAPAEQNPSQGCSIKWRS